MREGAANGDSPYSTRPLFIAAWTRTPAVVLESTLSNTIDGLELCTPPICQLSSVYVNRFAFRKQEAVVCVSTGG